MLPILPYRGTDDTRQLCSELAAQSGGVCVLGFSRGKDSIAAWLWLRQFFSRIIPFHCAPIPHLKFIDDSLVYYEGVFGTKIERCLSGECSGLIGEMELQPLEDEDKIRSLKLWSYTNNHVARIVKQKYGIEHCYTAYSMSVNDSLHRRVHFAWRKKRVQAGSSPLKEYTSSRTKSFYPCYDWTGDMVLEIIRQHKVRLPIDYLLSKSSFARIVSAETLAMRDHPLFREDYKRIERLFPFIGAVYARNEFRKRRQEAQRDHSTEEWLHSGR